MTIIYKSLAARLRFLSSVCGLALLTVLSTTGVVAQVGPPNGTATVAGTALAGTTAYTFAQSSGTYTAITGGTVYQTGATISTDAVSAAVNIGFNYRYNNRTYSTVRISNNGFITFGDNAPLTTTYTALSTNVSPAYEGAIAGFAANLRASAVVGASPEIRYETLGASPNRTFVVQYQDVAILTTGVIQRLSFQIRLNETTNTVAIVYGTTASGATASTGQVGLKGGESSDMSNRTGTNWTAITGGTLTTSTCTIGTTNGTTIPASGLTFTWTPGTTWSAASYATLPYLNDFATWSNVLNTGDSPGSNVRTWPSRGDVSWRSSSTLVSGFTSTTGWTGVSGAIATFSGTAVAPGARFHSFDCTAGSYGDMDFYLNLSSSPIGLYNLQFLHNNPSGTDVIQVFYSGDGGATFTQVGSNIGTAGNAWNTFSSNISGTATSVIRIRAIGDFGNDDPTIDNFRVTALTCASPSALVYTPSSGTGGTLSWTNPSSGTPTNYEYEIRTSGAAGSGATGLVTSGTIANPTNSAAISAGTLLANTAYSAYIRTDCGGGDLSSWSVATAFTTPCSPAVAPFSQTFATAYSLAPTGNPTCWREATGAINLSGNSTVTTGTNSWGTTNFANVAGNLGFKINLYGANNAWVITEPITLGSGNWSLAYSMAVTNYNGTTAVADLGTHAVRIIVSTDFGTTWSSANILKTYTGAAAYSTAGATEYVSLNAYAGQTVQIGFVATTSLTTPDIDFHLDNIAVIVPCSGTPVIGASAQASPTTLPCAGSVVSLTMDAGAQVGAGVSYQWASSADGVTFNNISGATGSTYSTPAAVISSTYYRGTATCYFSGLSNTTADYFVEAGFPTPTVSAFPPQYCGTGGTSAVTATITGANPYDTFVWSSPETGVLSNQTNTTTDFTITQSAAYTYTVTDTTTGCTRVVSKSLNVLGGVSPTPTATPSIVCAGGTSVLASGLSAASFSSAAIAHNPISASTTLVNAGTVSVAQTSGSLDDGGWGGVPIGFTFNFFGTDFTTMNVGTNGTVMFGTYNGTALADFTFTTLPSATEPNPMIAVLAMDNDLAGATGGAIKYRTLGYPGNRVFVLAYENVKEFGDTKFSTATLHLYEATGEIEVHVTSSTNVDRVKLVGVNGPGGLVGTLAYNSGTTASAINPIASPFAYRFTPPQNYTTAWTPSSDISGSATGTNLFGRTTNVLSTAGVINFNLQLTNQQTGCVSNVAIPVTVVDAPIAPVSASIEAYGSSLGASSASQTPLTVCGAQDVKLVYVGALGSTEQVKWYNAATGGTLLATNDTLDIAGLSAADTVWAAINNGACAESARFQYRINYNTPPAVNVNSLGPDSDVNCGEGPTYGMSYSMSSAASPAYTYTWSTDGNAVTFTDNGGGSATLTATETTTSTWSAFQAGTGCIISGDKSFGIYPFPAITPTAADTMICIGDTTEIFSNLSTSNFAVKCVPFAYRTEPAGAIDLCQGGTRNNSYGGTASLDDGGWDSVPLGFTFNYFGQDFTTVNVGTNGVINFGPYANFNVSQYSFPSGFPSASSPVNTIGVLATDFYMTTQGHVTFWTEGAAPNRVFVIEYQGPGWTADGSLRAQCHLYETLGLVEIHVERATSTGTFAGPKTIGLQNGDGTVGATAPVACDVNGNQVGLATWNARTSTIAAAASQAWRFSPPVSYTFAWSPSAEIAGSTTSATALAAPTATTPGSQSYFVTVTDNLSGCVGTPVELNFDLISPVAAPDVVGWGVLSDLDGTNTVAFCAEQDLNLYVAAGAGYDSTYNAIWYTQELGGTGFSIAYYDTVAYGVAGPAGIAADDSLWVSIDNGICEGPRRLVILDFQEPDSLAVINTSPVNCGPSSITYTSNLSVSSAGSYTYTWAPAGALDVTTGSAVVATVNQTTNVTVTAVDAIGFCTVTESSPVSVYGFPVVTPTADNDSICPGGQTLLSSNTSATNFTIESIGYSPTSESGSTTLVSNGVIGSQALAVGSLDDGVWTGIPIGFSYYFLGNEYTTLGVGTNGNLQFGPTYSTAYTATFGAAAPNNFIGLFWTDLNFVSTNGPNSIRYWTSGTAPNRVFSVAMAGYRFGGFGAGERLAGQIDLYETTGLARVHIQQVVASGFDVTIVGCEDLTGTIGSAAPGRSNATWSVSTPEGWEFIPPVDYSFSWLPTSAINGQADLSTAVAEPSATQQYQLVVTDNNTGCENSLNNQAYVTVTIASAAPNASFVANDLTVSTGGVLQVVNFTNNTPQLGGESWVWTFNPTTVQFAGGTNANSYQPQVQFLSPGDYTVTLSVTSCTGTDDLVRTNYITAIPEYCFPSFGTGSGFDGCDDGDAVGNVVITNPASVNVMQHLNTGCTTQPNAYEQFAPVAGVTSATLYQGTTYSMQVTSVSPIYTEFFAAYLDVNDDGDFSDPLEFLGGNASAAISATFDIGIPTSNVTYGLHRLRVIAAFGTGALDAADACIVTSFGEAHDYFVNIQPPVVLNDIPAFATNVAYSTNLNYPTCYPITGNTALASNSPESAGATGNDLWFRFTAQSTGVSISLTSATMDDYIGLYSRDLAGNYNLVASENVGTGAGDFERLNVGGLTAGSQYWISVGSAAAGAGGAFSLCIQNLMPSSCAYAIPAGGFRLCDAFKAIYRGAPSQGVTYNFTFTPVAPTPGVATTITGTNGLITLSNAVLALQYGGVYNAKVDVLYTLNNSASVAEPVLVQGNPAAPTCSNVPMQAHPLMEVRSSQRCPATLLRSNYLVGTTVSGSTSSAVCGALNYTYEFTQVTSCANGAVISVAPATYTTAFATPYLGLGVLGNLPNAGAWDVRIRPNFSYGPGTYGPVQRINVNNTSASSMLNEDAAEMDVKVESFVAANLYPNPNNGEMVNLNVSGIESDNLFVRITDAMGRVVYTNRFAVEGSLNTIVTFSEALSSGIYNVEFTVDGQIMTERMIVAKQ